jgi:hypothetical protein
MHNQNDVGSFIVQVAGEPLLEDPGSGRYTRQYFSAEGWSLFTKRSLSHSVPMINGNDQPHGQHARAEVVSQRCGDDADTVIYELAGAYPDEPLSSLQRTLTLDRTAPRGRVALTDHCTFEGEPGRFESVLITLVEPVMGDGQVELRGQRGALRITYDAATTEVRLDIHEAAAFAFGDADVYRLVFTPKAPEADVRVSLAIEPID